MLNKYHAKLKDATMENFHDKPDDIKSIRIISSTTTTIEFEWDEPCSNNSTITGYSVYLNGEVQVENLGELFYVIENLQPKTCYKIHVVANSDQGDGYKNEEATLV
jgi:hypothetical protein